MMMISVICKLLLTKEINHISFVHLARQLVFFIIIIIIYYYYVST